MTYHEDFRLIGQQDAECDMPFAPELWTTEKQRTLDYIEGFLQVRPTCAPALEMRERLSPSFQPQLAGFRVEFLNDYAEHWPDDDDWPNEPGYAEACQYPR